MKSVLYTDDMKPITIMELPIEVHIFLFRVYHVEIKEPAKTRMIPLNEAPKEQSFKTVDILVEKFFRKDKVYPLFITSDLELALKLKSELLPGQVEEWDDYYYEYRRGFINGLITAIERGI